MKSSDATSTSKPIDSRRLEAFARENDLAFHWRTGLRQGRWQAEVRLGPDDRMVCWASDGDTEQAALDTAMLYAISYYVERARRRAMTIERGPG